MEDGGGGELYFGRSTLFRAGAGRLLASKDVGGELGLATIIDVVGDVETAFAISDSDGSVAWWGCGVVGTSILAVSSNCIDSSMVTNSDR
jgi:hypothetical protein